MTWSALPKTNTCTWPGGSTGFCSPFVIPVLFMSSSVTQMIMLWFLCTHQRDSTGREILVVTWSFPNTLIVQDDFLYRQSIHSSQGITFKILGAEMFLHNLFSSNEYIHNIKRWFLSVTINSLFCSETRISLNVDPRIISREYSELWLWVLVFTASFNKISVKSCE
jgi:hypothetical protein